MSTTAHRAGTILATEPNLAERALGAAGLVLVVAIGIGLLAFFLAALLSVLGADLGFGVKLIWFVAIPCLPFLGSLLWFAAGRPKRYRPL